MTGNLRRLASPSDAPLLAALHARCFEIGGGEVWDEPAVKTLLATPGIFAFLILAPADHPAVGVTWYDAMAYGAWLGGNLPPDSRAVWEEMFKGARRISPGEDPRRGTRVVLDRPDLVPDALISYRLAIPSSTRPRSN